MKTTFLKRAVNTIFMFSLLTTFFTFTSCSNSEKENLHKSLNEFKAYVKDHKDASAKYMDQKWEDLEKEYDQKKAALDKNADKMDQEMKDSYQATVNDWEAFKANYLSKQQEKEDLAKAEKLKATIIPSDVHTDLSNVTEKNIVSVFTHFVNTVDNQKEMYSKEEWRSINSYWKSLNDISAHIDDAHKISKEDNRKLDALRFKYGAIKALNKPFAKSEYK